MQKLLEGIREGRVIFVEIDALSFAGNTHILDGKLYVILVDWSLDVDVVFAVV